MRTAECVNRQFKFKDPASAISHLIGMIMAIFVATPLIIRASSARDAIHVISLTIYVMSIILLYGASTLYHTFDLSENMILKKLDHCMIFVMIAGSYTPICLIVLHGHVGYAMFALVWGIALCGIIYTIGGVIYALKLSIFNSRHQNFGSHEIFHLFIIAGSICHFVVMYQYVAVFPIV